MSLFLAPFETLYRRQMQRRRAAMLERRDREMAPCPILSIGNLTTGGTGKTPATQWAAHFLKKAGWKVAIVSRGYGGTLSDQGALVSDGETTFLSAQQAGDEPILHARVPGVAVVIGKNRHEAVDKAVEWGAQIVLLDDGFQFWSLPRAFDLVLLDAKKPWGNGHLLPRGRLREELAALERADAILLTRANRASDDELAQTRRKVEKCTQAPIWESSHAPQSLRDEKSGEILPLEALRGCEINAISALADNVQFQRHLKTLGAKIFLPLAEKDHHAWKKCQFERELSGRFMEKGWTMRRLLAQNPSVTTEKDAVKLDPNWFDGPLWSLQIALEVRDAASLQALICDKLGLLPCPD